MIKYSELLIYVIIITITKVVSLNTQNASHNSLLEA